jgi:acetyltransferase-like isoleucine patch superfamily enzyme
MINIDAFIPNFSLFAKQNKQAPWELVKHISQTIELRILQLQQDYTIVNNIAIHKTAVVEEGAILKGPIIISANCFVAAHAYIRHGVYLAENVIVGPGCEIKNSIIMSKTTLAHFNPDYALAIFEVNFSILQALEIIDGIILRRMVLLKIYKATY